MLMWRTRGNQDKRLAILGAQSPLQGSLPVFNTPWTEMSYLPRVKQCHPFNIDYNVVDHIATIASLLTPSPIYFKRLIPYYLQALGLSSAPCSIYDIPCQV